MSNNWRIASQRLALVTIIVLAGSVLIVVLPEATAARPDCDPTTSPPPNRVVPGFCRAHGPPPGPR